MLAINRIRILDDEARTFYCKVLDDEGPLITGEHNAFLVLIFYLNFNNEFRIFNYHS